MTAAELRKLILDVSDLPREAVVVPEWGATVYVRTMTGTEKDAWEQGLWSNKDGDDEQKPVNWRAGFLARCIVDEAGERIFTDEDVVALGSKSASALDRIMPIAKRLNGMTTADEKAMPKNE